MIRQFIFDQSLFKKRIGSIWTMISIDICYIIIGPFFGIIGMKQLFSIISVVHILLTCMLFQIFTISQGEFILELNTEKSIYFPTTRLNYLKSKYLVTLLFLCFQILITLICLGLGYLGNKGHLDLDYVIGGLFILLTNILFTSGIITLVMHINPMAIYVPLILSLPFILISNGVIYLLKQDYYNVILIMALISVLLWIILLFLGKYIYERL